MDQNYQNPKALAGYLAYLDSADAKAEQDLIFSALSPLLPKNPDAKILDAACGSGWLLARLASRFKSISAFDMSPELIDIARKNYPTLDFKIADAVKPLPYPDNSFDAIILNMAAHDIGNLKIAVANLYKILKPNGQFIMAVANPYYAYPVGVWKRGFLRFLLGLKPVLKLRPYNKYARDQKRLFFWKKAIPSYFIAMPEYFNAILKAGFILTKFEEIISPEDSSNFGRFYQLYRFPAILLLVFKKPAE